MGIVLFGSPYLYNLVSWMWHWPSGMKVKRIHPKFPLTRKPVGNWFPLNYKTIPIEHRMSLHFPLLNLKRNKEQCHVCYIQMTNECCESCHSSVFNSIQFNNNFNNACLQFFNTRPGVVLLLLDFESNCCYNLLLQYCLL